MRLSLALPIVVPLLVLAGALRGVGRSDPPSFPHEEHVGLFPLCAGCHQGVPSGDRSRFFPPPEACAGCHDGVERERVEWSGPAPTEPGNLAFSHPVHAEALSAPGRSGLSCSACHGTAGTPPMAEVTGPLPSTCLSCHAEEIGDPYQESVVYERDPAAHYEDGPCLDCHLPLASTDLGPGQIRSLPAPESHESDAFLVRLHGEQARAEPFRCAACHTRERCTSCHVLPPAVASEIPAAPPTMELPFFAAEYPVPESHTRPGWMAEHGSRAAEATCATCHTRTDCAACHQGPPPPSVAALPGRDEVTAPGVGLRRRAPATHDSPFWVEGHGGVAATDPASCATCHTEATCTTCHDGGAGGGVEVQSDARGYTQPRDPAGADEGRHGTRPLAWPLAPRAEADAEGGGFHPPNFAVRHSSDAYGATLECSSCHSTEVFCRGCHLEVGFGSEGRLGPGFHDAEPLWLLRHGQAARQSLESCATCHQQRNCLQCHSTVGAFRVNPHGPGFDAERAWERSPRTCAACHVSPPLGG